jgi:hypothetical protein
VRRNSTDVRRCRTNLDRILPLVLAVVLAVSLGGGPARGAGYPPLPIADDRGFLGNLSAPTFSPGGSGNLAFSVSDPLPAAISGVVLTFDVYAFNAFPGNATSMVPVAGAPVLSTPTTSGAWANVSVGNLAPGQTYRGSLGVTSSATTPSGTFAVRTGVAFTLLSNGTSYRLESRGWFTAATWLAATELPNGSATLNLSVLGVSGVTPETAIFVGSSTFDWLLTGLLVAGFVLVGAGAYFYFRRGPGSRSGTR